MNRYEDPTIKVVEFASEDVITTSGGEILDPIKDSYTTNNDTYDNILDGLIG